MKNNNKGLKILVIILTILVLILGSYIIYEKLLNDNTNQITNDNEQKNSLNYSTLVGEYVDSEGSNVEDTRKSGGIILNIFSISETALEMDIESVSYNERVAKVSKEDIEITNIDGNKYNFTWKNDGWNNSGTGTLTINNNNVSIMIKTTNTDENNTSGWGLGYVNEIMYKASENGKNTINNDNVKEEDLEEVLKILGVTTGTNYCNACLNYYLSQENYYENIQHIISFYRDAYNYGLLALPEDIYSKECYGAADCLGITKTDAEYLIKTYNIEKYRDKYFDDRAKSDEYYIFYYNHALRQCEYDIIHEIKSEYINTKDIKITDNQTIKEYEPFYNTEDQILKNTTTKNVEYTLKINEDGNYYLYQVKVK